MFRETFNVLLSKNLNLALGFTVRRLTSRLNTLVNVDPGYDTRNMVRINGHQYVTKMIKQCQPPHKQILNKENGYCRSLENFSFGGTG